MTEEKAVSPNKTMPGNLWYKLEVEDVFGKIESSREGLAESEAMARQKKYGPNRLPEKKPLGALIIFISQFKSAFIYILLIAAVLSFVLGENTDATVILVAVGINVLVGFLQEYKAQRALEALQKVVLSQARVRRDGKMIILPAAELVPGDIIWLQAGDKVPADLRIFEARDLEIAEATLTGESQPVRKNIEPLSGNLVLGDQRNLAFMSTVVTQGTAQCVVVATGTDTAIGHIATLVKETKEEETPLQRKLSRFSKKLGILVLGLSLLIFIVGLVSNHSLGEMFTTAVAVAVAAIPEGMVVAVTVILATGMRRILKKKGLVKKLLAAETLGSTSVICADKTGTLTLGEMVMTTIVGSSRAWPIDAWPSAGPESEAGLCLRVGVLCNNAFFLNEDPNQPGSRLSGSPTEKALLLAGRNASLDKDQLNQQYPRLDEAPFNSQKKYMLTLHRQTVEENIVYLKGASEKVLEFCGQVFQPDGSGSNAELSALTPGMKQHLMEEFEQMSTSGLRVLAIAYKKVPSRVVTFKDPVLAGIDNYLDKPASDRDTSLGGFIFAGFVGLQDPLRPETKETVAISQAAGVKTVMITGDHKLTAQAIARDLGLPHQAENILTGEELIKLTSEELKERVPDISVFARVTPEDKLKIVQAWQERGEVVAMTGDGVNDAPALKKADIGVAVGSGTDVSKETADLILLDDDFKTIIAAIRQGRVIYDNVKKVILYFLSDSFTEMILIAAGLLLGWPLPVLASQILWVNIVDDSFPALALTQDPEEPENMSEKPEKRDRPVLDLERRLLIIIISTVTALGTMLLFWFYWRHLDAGLAHARTVAFAVLGIDSLLYIFAVKSLRRPIWKINFFDNKFLVYAVLAGIVMQVVAVYAPFFQQFLQTVPLNARDWLYITGASLAVILVIEIIKGIFFKLQKKTTGSGAPNDAVV